MITYYGSMLLWGSPRKHGGFLGSANGCSSSRASSAASSRRSAGYVVGLPSLRLRGDYLAIVTLGFGEILRVILQQTEPVIDDAASSCRRRSCRRLLSAAGRRRGRVSTACRSTRTCFGSTLFVAFMLVVAFRLKRSSLGRAMISVREDEFAAQAMGVNVARVKVLAFMMAAFFAGMAGGLYAHEVGNNISPHDAGFQRSFDYVLMTVLGGRGSITGVMLAAIILTVLPEALRDFDQYRLIVYALLLIGMMLLRPQGLFGIHEIWDFWPKRSATERQARRRRMTQPHQSTPPVPAADAAARRRRHRHFVRRLEGGAEVFDPLAARCAVRPDRSQRRGQDDRLQSADRRLSNDGRADACSTRRTWSG